VVYDSFDHGAAAMPSAGLPPVADDGVPMNITDPAFNSEDVTTWGLTQPERRVWGLAVFDGRLYYSVWDGPRIWSVGIDGSGRFSNDARLEFALPVEQGAAPVSSMVFDQKGVLYLAQRGGIAGSYDYSVFATGKTSKVLRYARDKDAGKWSPIPEEYAVGFPPPHLNGSGGVDLGYGHNAQGQLDLNQCERMVWMTGDALRNDPALSEKLQPGGALEVHGLQGNDASLVRPANTPPWSSYFVDYDGRYGDPLAEGYVGAVKVFRAPCGAGGGYTSIPPRCGPPCAPGSPGCACQPGEPCYPPCEPNGPCYPSCRHGEPGCGECGPCPPCLKPCPRGVHCLCAPGTGGNTGVRCAVPCKPGEPGCNCPSCPPCYQCPPERRKPDGSCCPPDQQWHPETRSCLPCPPERRKPDGSCCPPDQQWHPETRSCLPCPPERRKPDGSCCPLGEKWSPETKTCHRGCPSGQDWNAQDKECSCGAGKRWNGQQCVSISIPIPTPCPSGLRLNALTGQCERLSCPPGWRWDGRKCVEPEPHTHDPRTCPDGKHWNGRACIGDSEAHRRAESLRLIPNREPHNPHTCPDGKHWNGHACIGGSEAHHRAESLRSTHNRYASKRDHGRPRAEPRREGHKVYMSHARHGSHMIERRRNRTNRTNGKSHIPSGRTHGTERRGSSLMGHSDRR
jgi:hypothetical protein